MRPGPRFYLATAFYVLIVATLAGVSLNGEGETGYAVYLVALVLTLPLAIAYPFWGPLLVITEAAAYVVSPRAALPVGVLFFAAIAVANAYLVRWLVGIARPVWHAGRARCAARSRSWG